MGYSKVNVHEIEPAGPGGAVRFVRRELGVEAGSTGSSCRPTSAGESTTSAIRAKRKST